MSSAEAYVIWRKRYVNYLIDELCRGVARSELARELINNTEGPAAGILLDVTIPTRNDEGDPDGMAAVANPPAAAISFTSSWFGSVYGDC